MPLLRVGEYSLVVHAVVLLLQCLAYARMADVTGRRSADDMTEQALIRMCLLPAAG